MSDGWRILGPVESGVRISMLVYLNVNEAAMLDLFLKVFNPTNVKFRKLPSLQKIVRTSRYTDSGDVLELLAKYGDVRVSPVMPDRLNFIAKPPQIRDLFGIHLNYAYLEPYSPEKVKIVPDGDYRSRMSDWLKEQIVAIPFLEVQGLEWEFTSAPPKQQDISDIAVWTVENLRKRYILPEYSVHNPIRIGSWQPNWTGVGSFDTNNLSDVVHDPDGYAHEHITQKEVCVDFGYNEESSFSLQIMVGMAPGTHITIYQDWGEIVGSRRMDKQNSLFDYLYQNYASQNVPRIWCFTWLQKESAVRPEHARRINFELMRLSLLGYTFVCASGDWANGFVDEWDPNSVSSRKSIPLIPSSFPTVVSVGASEVSTKDRSEESPARILGKWCTGYGESDVFQASIYCPWQGKVGGRKYPDILALGQLFQLRHDGKTGLRYGTSLSAPVLASFLSQTHMRPLGNINRVLFDVTRAHGMYLRPHYLTWLRTTQYPARTFRNFGMYTLIGYMVAGMALLVLVVVMRQVFR